MIVRCAERQRQVLIVDSSPDSRGVLRVALERRGLRILEASEVTDGLRIARAHRPELIVLDTEDLSDEGTAQEAFAAESRKFSGALLILGRAASRAELPDRGCVVPKPYHYGPLIRTIEQIVEDGVQDGVAVCDPRPRSGETVRTP